MSDTADASNDGNLMVDKLLAIAKHGELRDIEFVEKVFGTRFCIDRNDLIIFPDSLGVANVISAFELKPSIDIFKGATFRYRISTDSDRPLLGPNDKILIASMDFDDPAGTLRVTPQVIRDKLGTKETYTTLGSRPPQSISYNFTTKKTKKYSTGIGVIESRIDTGFSPAISIGQIKE